MASGHMKTAIVGGGAAGFFLAVCLKEMRPEMEVTIFERSHHVLAKVKVSGGGRCNCTNTFEGVADLSAVYPRGHRLMKRLMRQFNQHDAYLWFERHGVKLTVQEDQCVFPESQDSQTIIDCFVNAAQRLGVRVVRGHCIGSLSELDDFDFVAVTTGGQPKADRLLWLQEAGHAIEQPVPSLFSLSVADDALHQLMGTVVGSVQVMIPGTRLRATGALLITHWGLSGPAVLRLSSYAARYLSESDYKVQLSVNWLCMTDAQVQQLMGGMQERYAQRQLRNAHPTELPVRLWHYLLSKSVGEQKAQLTWRELGRKDLNRLVNTLCNDTYLSSGRPVFKDEFVTCGGISLSSVVPATLESRHRPGLYFAGEVLDIDGVTGGFNFQAAWTTAYTVAKAIAEQFSSNLPEGS